MVVPDLLEPPAEGCASVVGIEGLPALVEPVPWPAGDVWWPLVEDFLPALARDCVPGFSLFDVLDPLGDLAIIEGLSVAVVLCVFEVSTVHRASARAARCASLASLSCPGGDAGALWSLVDQMDAPRSEIVEAGLCGLPVASTGLFLD